MDQTTRPLALVTGAAHRLGKALAQGLARQGYAIGLHFHQSIREAQQTAAELHALDVPILLLPADLRNENDIKSMFKIVEDSAYPLRVLVNSAGVMTTGDLATMSALEWDNTFNLNLRAAWLCSQAAARLMKPEGGTIINISDAGAGKLWTKYPSYVLTKSALETLTRLLAKTLAPSIRVNAVAPGLVLPPEDFQVKEWEKLENRVPLKSSVTTEDIQQAVRFLIENRQITGQVITVDGGFQLV